MVPRSERVRPETSSLWAPLHEQPWKLQMLLSERVRLDAWRLLHQWVTSSSKEQEAIEARAIDLRSIFFVFEPMCSDSRTCSLAHCQYGCEEVQGEIRCLCPSPGLQLGEDERTCVGEERRGEPFCWFPIFWLPQWVWEKTVFWLQPTALISESTLFGPCLSARQGFF